MDNPFLARDEREADQTPSLPNENPFASSAAQSRVAITAAAGVVNSTTVAQREGAQRLATHVVKKGCSIGCGSVWLPGCCGREASRVKLRWHLLLLAVPVLTVLNAMRSSFSLRSLFLALANVPLLYLAVLIHEIGHLVMAKAHGGIPSHILLWPLGGMAFAHGPTSACLALNLHPSPGPGPGPGA